MSTRSNKKSQSKKQCLLSSRLHKKRKPFIDILASNPDPFASDTSLSSKTSKSIVSSTRSSKNTNKRNSSLYSTYLTPNQPKKKRKVSSRTHSHTSQSSSDIEILNTNTHTHHKSNMNHNHNGHHKRSKVPKRHSPPKQSYNIYANNIITHNGYHSTLSTDHSNSNHSNQNIEIPSPIPFPKEKNRSKLHTMDIQSVSCSTQRNKSYEETYSQLDKISRRSKSRSPSPTKSLSPFSQISSKMTEPQDQMAMLGLSKRTKPKQQLAFREAVHDAKQQIQRKQNKKSNVKYSSLDGLPSSKTYSRNRGGKHRKKLRKFKERFISIRSSNLNDLPQPSMSRNGEILTTDLDKKDYENLMEIKRNEKRERISQHWDPCLADFVDETDMMEREKGKGKEKEKEEEKVEIDLTNDNEDIEILNEDDDEDVVILNDRKPSRLKKRSQRKLFPMAIQSPWKRRANLCQLRKSPARKIKSQFIAIDMFLLRKTRAEGRRKWNSMIEDDVWRTQKFGESWNAKDAQCYRIQRWIIEYKEKKELERKRKEKKEKELKAKASVSMCRDLKVRPLDDDDNGLIDEVFELDLNHIVAAHQKSNIEVRVKDLHTLEEGQWLNDEVMNFYMALLQDRNLKRIEDDSKCIRVLFMNTFFFTKLSSNSYNYKAVKRWTKKVKLEKKGLRAISNIFELDKLIFPVHVNKIHWCCGCINFKNKTFEYFDSMNGSSTEFFRIIRKYIEDEFNDKLKKDKRKYNLNLNEWSNDSHSNTYPQQQNGFDCGVFTSKCADWISDDLEPDYNQRNMQYFRDRIMVEIIRGKTLDF